MSTASIIRVLPAVGLICACNAPARDDMGPHLTSASLRPGFHLPGLTGASYVDLTPTPTGLVVAGAYDQAGAASGRPARWTGDAWESLPPFGDAYRLAADGAGSLYAVSQSVNCLECGPPRFARLDGEQWIDLSLPLTGTVTAITGLSVGFLVAGELVLDSPTNLVRFNGSTTTSVASTSGSTGNGRILAVAANNGVVCVGGEFSEINGVAAQCVACLENNIWSPLGAGLDGEVRSLAFRGEELVAGGRFQAPGGANLAAFSSQGWNAIGAGVEVEASVDVVAVHMNAVYAGGTFTTPTRNVGRFDGSWHALPGGIESGTAISDIAVVNGEVFVAGGFTRIGTNTTAGVAKWSESGSTALVDAGDNPLGVVGDVRTVIWDDADLLVGGASLGSRFSPTTSVLRLRNGEWQAVGALDASVNVLHRSTGGEIFAGTDAGELLKLSTEGWETSGTLDGAITAIVDTGSSLLVGGDFSDRVVQFGAGGFVATGASNLGPVRALGIADGRICAGVDLSTSAMSSESLMPFWCSDGVQWAPETALRGSLVTTIATTDSGALWVGGSLWMDHPAVAASFDGQWRAFDLPLASSPARVISFGNRLAIAGSDRVHYWDGTTVVKVLEARGSVKAVALSDNAIVVGGSAVFIGGPVAAGVAILDLQHESP